MNEYEFACPDCGQGMAIDARTRAALLSNGCPICTAPVSPEHVADG